MTKKHVPLLGAHISSAGGLATVFERAASIGCTTLQLFTKSNRQWAAKNLTKEQITEFKATQKNCAIKPLVAHAGYLINCGSSDPDIARKSLNSLRDELNRCDELEIPCLVLHPGSCGKSSREVCLENLIKSLDTALVDTSTTLAIELMAGQGNGLGNTLEELGIIYHGVKHHAKLGVCVDTCHAFATGYDLSNPEGYKAFWHTFDKELGVKTLKVIHLNDSKKALGSHVDRHENIGKGVMGLEAFRLIMNDKNLQNVPKILETPPGDLETYKKDMETLLQLIK